MRAEPFTNDDGLRDYTIRQSDRVASAFATGVLVGFCLALLAGVITWGLQ